MGKIGLFYGSTTGNTENIAEQLQELLGDTVELHNVDSAEATELESYDALIFGASTWGAGDLQDDFEPFLDNLEAAGVSGKKVAIFGTGDASSYPDTFVDSIGIIYEKLTELGATVVGHVDASAYSYDDSAAVKDGKFVGLPIDEDSEPHKTPGRVKAWAAQLQEELIGVAV